MCIHGTTKVLEIKGIKRDIDFCLYEHIKTLNESGIATIASCCGHGHRPGNIALADGRELIIARNYDEARSIDKMFKFDIHGERKSNDTETINQKT